MGKFYEMEIILPCDGLIDECHPYSLAFEHLVLGGTVCWGGGLRRCGLAGGSISVKVGFDVSSPRTIPTVLSLHSAMV